MGAVRDQVRSSHCTDNHKSGTSTSRGSVRFKRTGVFGMFCPHGVCLLMLHMDVGERYAYAAACLYVAVKEKQGPVDFCWYDIGPCKFRWWWERFVDELPPEYATEEEKAWMRACQFPLCTFHCHMHISECQRDWAAEKFEGAGTGTGEPPEQFWAQFGKLAHRTQYHRLAKLMVVFEAYISQSNLLKDVRCPPCLNFDGQPVFPAPRKRRRVSSGHSALPPAPHAALISLPPDSSQERMPQLVMTLLYNAHVKRSAAFAGLKAKEALLAVLGKTKEEAVEMW